MSRKVDKQEQARKQFLRSKAASPETEMLGERVQRGESSLGAQGQDSRRASSRTRSANSACC